MEPLRGGKLVNGLNKDISSILLNENNNWSMAEWGLKYLWNKREINIVLSGMSNIKQVKDNVRIANSAVVGMLTIGQEKALELAGNLYHKTMHAPCTNCRYCSECPQGISISWLMYAYNDSATMDFIASKEWYLSIRNEGGNCIECKKCEDICPQNIKIIQAIKDADELFGYEKLM